MEKVRPIYIETRQNFGGRGCYSSRYRLHKKSESRSAPAGVDLGSILGHFGI